MDLYSLDHPGDLTSPALIVAFEGWVSAGSAGTATARHIAGEGDVVATFDSDALFDYRVNRPTIEFLDGALDALEWPEVTLRRRTVDNRDALVLSGPEPNWGWQQLGRAVAELCVELGITQQISLGGIPWATPHTRPTIVVTTASSRELIAHDANYPEGLLRVPASIASTIEQSVATKGVPTVGFWARVPHYVAATYWPAVLTLTERVSLQLGIHVPLGALIDNTAAQRRELDDAVADQAQAKAMVERLEDLHDAQGDVASGEEIAAEIQRYLQEEAGRDDG